MNCNHCQAEIAQNSSFCGNCGAKIESTQVVSKNQEVITFHSMEELTSFLNNKSQTYKGALAKVLTSQLEVLKSVQSSELSSLTFDLLLDNLHMAIQESESKTQEVEIQQKFSLMINAYVFFSQAKIEAASAANKREADALLATGANIMAKSVTAVVQYAVTQSVNIQAVVEIANDVFGSSEGKPSFIEKCVNWWRKDVRIKESQAVFIKTVDVLVDKLNDDRNLIGPSRIIHGFVKQYAPKLIDFNMAPLYNAHASIAEDYNNFTKKIKETNLSLMSILLSVVLCVNSVVYAILIMIWLLTFWVSFIADWSAVDWIKGYNSIALGSIVVSALIIIVVLIVNALRISVRKRKTNAILSKYNVQIATEENKLNGYYGDILQYFKNY